MKKLIIPVCTAVIFTALSCCCGGGGSHVSTTSFSTLATTAPTTTERETFIRETIQEDPDAAKFDVTFKIHVNESKDYFNEDSFLGGIANEALKNDAAFFLDGNQIKIIANGHDYETTLEISEGTHIIRFERSEFASDDYLSAPEENMGYVEDRFTIHGESIVSCSVDIGLSRMSLDDLLVREPSETELQTESETEPAVQNETTAPSVESESVTEETKQEAASRDDSYIDPEFKAFWDGYESFMDRYVKFMKDYQQGNSPASALMDYLQIMNEYAKWVEDCENYQNADQSQFTAAELKYEMEVITRVEAKLLDVVL